MKNGWMVAALAVTGLPTSANAQTIFETLNNLRTTVRQLGGRPAKPQPASVPTAPIVAATSDASEFRPMVPATALSEDASDTSLEATPLAKSNVETFDVLGYKLGMSPREVVRIAARNGIYAGAAAAQLSGSFELEATELANRQLNRPVQQRSKSYLAVAFGESRRGETFIFSFTLEPSGPKLSRLTMEAKLNGQTSEQVQAILAAKYGAPHRDGLVWGITPYCLGPDCKPSLQANIFGPKLTLVLDRGTAYARKMRAALESRAQEIAAQHGSGVRF